MEILGLLVGYVIAASCIGSFENSRIKSRLDKLETNFKNIVDNTKILSDQWETWRKDYNSNVTMLNKAMEDISELMIELNRSAPLMKEALPIMVEIKASLPMIKEAAQKLQDFNKLY